MPWPEQSTMELRGEFVMLAGAAEANVSELCRRYRISRKTGYKWLGRARSGDDGLADRSRRPHGSPGRTSALVEASVVGLRLEHPAWGGRKLSRRLRDLGEASPAPSTVTAILRRHGLLEPVRSPQAYQRFEQAQPNELWQMDFKGHFAHAAGRCHPLTVLDDHSRFSLTLEACADETTATVRRRLETTFRRYGLPWRMLMDNGSPWGNSTAERFTPLGVWLMRLGIRVSHGRPYHPQTQGKDERFHRSLKAEVLSRGPFRDLDHCQAAFDRWRQIYNRQRPHQALDLAVPASRYHLSPRRFPDTLPPLDYDTDHQVRRVQDGGRISFKGRDWRLPKAFRGQPVGLRPTTTDGLWDVVFAVQRIAQIDLRDPLDTITPVTHVPEHV